MSSLEIKQRALDLGFLACGIIPTNIFHEFSHYLDERVKSFPQSKEFYKPMYDKAHQPENAKTIIVCTKRYNQYRVPDSLQGLIGKTYLFDSRVPYSREYREKVEFESCLKLLGMNILPVSVPERFAAAKAGLGRFGRNNFLYDPEHGSYIWISTWVVDKELEYDVIKNEYQLPGCNDGCHKCIKFCPTKALSGSFAMDGSRCITYLSCNAKNTLEENTRLQMGSWLYGCDVCQDVCPLNKNKFSESEEYPLLAEFEEYLKPECIVEMNERTYKSILHPRFWYIGEDNLWLWKCNALRNMINSRDPKYHSLIKKCGNHEDARIREIAQWGVQIPRSWHHAQ